MSSTNTEKILLATIAGITTGLFIGILVAPEKGSKMRKKLSQKSDGYLREIKKELNEIRSDLNKRIESTKNGLEERAKRGKAKIEEAEKEAKENIEDTTDEE